MYYLEIGKEYLHKIDSVKITEIKCKDILEHCATKSVFRLALETVSIRSLECPRVHLVPDCTAAFDGT